MSRKGCVMRIGSAIVVVVGLMSVVGGATAQDGKTVPQNGKIAFASDRDGNYEIYVMDSDGSNATRLTHNDASDLHPDWSADGSKIAFQSTVNLSTAIYIINADGSGLVNLTQNPSADYRYPAWSPDGTQLAFTAYTGGGTDIYVIAADGTGLTKVVDGNSERYYLFPTWSPDGTSILVSFTDEVVGVLSGSN